MILLFPNLDTLKLALTSNIVATDVTLAPAAVSFDPQGKVYVESTATLSKTTTKHLDKIGVKGSKRHATDSPEDVTCWPQVLPVTRESGAPNVSNQAPVLFELSDADDLPTLVSEMLRLGNDRQGFRWFAAPGEADTKRVLLRVIGPPYYTLLRALDKSAAGTKGTVRAYLERAPRVWVEIGHSHPLAAQIRVADTQLVLIRAPREWTYLDESAFQDVYDIMQFKLPTAPVGWTEAKAPKKMTVPLRLTAGNAADVPELWVVRENAVEQLDALVRDSDDRLTQRLMFAVATDADGERTVILRTRPSKLAPPHLPLENALGFKPFWKLPNLFVPVGRRVHPTLRRDAVRKLLADDPDLVVWLYPEGDGKFTPESIPDGAFRFLEEWVDYVIEAEQKPLAAWIEATGFDFDHFICKDTGPKKPGPGDKEPKGKDDTDDPKGLQGRGAQPKSAGKGKPAPRATSDADFLPAPEVVKPPSEWALRRKELEKQFLEVEGGLDAPERVALWPELAVANAGEGSDTQKAEAAICWLNAMWDTDPAPAEWLAGWVRSEQPKLTGSIKADEFDRQLAVAMGGQHEVRTAVASFLWLAGQNPVPVWLTSRLPTVQTFLEKNEGALPIRAVWLAAYRLAQLAGADVLGLARVRDRLLNRLLEQGLAIERDLPGFLRYAGHKDADRMRVVRDRALDLHAAVRKWSAHIPQNLPYIDLYFAWGLAKLHESTVAKKLVDDARLKMEVSVPTSWHDNKQFEAVVSAVTQNFLFKSFKHRIDQALANQPMTGVIPPALRAELDQIAEKGKTAGSNNPFNRAEYVINRLRHDSRIIEPQGTLHPYAAVTKTVEKLNQELSQLHSLRDSSQLVYRIRDLLKNGVATKSPEEVRFLVLREALILAPRAGEAFTLELLQLVPPTIAAWPANAPAITTDRIKEQGEMIERAMVLAGHYDRRDLVKQLSDEFSALLNGKKDEDRYKLVNVVGGQSLRIMKKLGMRDEIDRFYTKLHGEILRGQSMAQLKQKHASKPETWLWVLQTSLNLAGGWLSLGFAERAEPILKEARDELLGSKPASVNVKDYTPLARAYVTALGQGPSETGLNRITELFQKMDEKRITNSTTTAQCYSRFHLQLVEDTIRAVVSDEFALGPGGRKWLDDDEYLVRKRIHADMRRNLTAL